EKTVSLRPESRRDAHRASVPEVGGTVSGIWGNLQLQES
ncbi:hypothetical protein AK812_SmicGene48009, partial [Symbiodinium microadriaticum]